MKIRLKFLKRFANWIKEQFEKLSPKLQKAVEAGVKITEAVKSIIDNPSLNFLAELTKTNLDDEILEKIKGQIPGVLKTLNLVKDSSHPFGELLDEAFSKLLEKTDSEKALFWHSFSIEITKLASDGELSQADIIYLTQWYYDHHVNASQPSK